MKKLIRFSLFLALTAFLAVGVISGTALTAHASSGSDSCGAGISLSDTVSNHTPSVNDTITYTVSGSISLSDPTEISVKDILGDGSGDELTFVSATSSVGHYSSSTGIWDLGTLNNGQSVSLSIVATVDPGAAGKTIDNQPTYTESCCSTSQSILGVSIHVKPAIGTLSVSVHGLLNGATSTVALSDGTANAFSSSTVTGDTISPLSFSLDQGDSYSVTATTTAPGYTVATSTGCTDSSFSSGTDCVITFSSSEADLSLTKATLGGISTTTPSSTVTYVLTVKALGPATSTDVTVTDPLPAGIAYVSSAPSEGTTTFTAATGTPGTLVWTVGDMASGTVATTSVVTTVDANASGVITNTASVTESTSSTNLDPNTATSTITVEPAGCTYGACDEVSVLKTVSDPNPKGNETITYTIAVSNLNGTASSSDITVQDSLPTGLTLVSATTSQGGNPTDSGLGIITWDAGNIAPATTETLAISVIVNPSLDGQQNVVNTATAYTTLDPSVTLATGSATIAVQANTPVTPVCTTCGGGGGGGGTSTGGGGAGYDVAIDDGAPTTATTSATLSLYGTGAYQMEISNSTDFSSSTWQAYATVLPWTLTSGGGEKTVYVKYRDIQKNVLATVNDSIDLVQGQVLGASTSCGIYLNDYIKLGANNNKLEVEKLQAFLNQNLGASLPITGYYGPLTYKAVEAFQLKYNGSVLDPWVPYGLTSDSTPTGYVFKTTQRWINLLMCNTLNLPMPMLP